MNFIDKIQSGKTSKQTVKLKRPTLVFISSFVIIFSILNFQNLYSQIVYYFKPEPDEQAYNLELENIYKIKYGRSSLLLSASENKSIQTQNTLGQSLASIGKAAVLELNNNSVSKPAALASNIAIKTAVVSNFISVPKLNIKAPIISTPHNDKQILDSLKNGVVLYPGSVLPGQLGTTVIIGHSSSNFPFTKYSAIFAGLNKLVAGDFIYINHGGQNYTYIIKDKKIGSSDELSSVNLKNDLVLASCWPVGTDRSRIIILADLQ